MVKQNIFCDLLELIGELEMQVSGTKNTPLFNAFSKACVKQLLHRKGTGVTLLFPVDNKYREDLLEKIEGAKNTDEFEDAQLELSTLVMPEAVKDGNELVTAERNKSSGVGPLGNFHGDIYTFEKKGTSYAVKVRGTEIGTITNTPPKDVKVNTMYQSQFQLEFTVWFLTFTEKGKHFPVDKNSQAQYERKPTRSATGKKTGGHESYLQQAIAAKNQRFVLAKHLETEFAKCMSADGCKSQHPYLSTVVSLLNYLRVKKPNVYQCVLPSIDYDPLITFYILVEPYKTSGQYFISDADLFENGGCWHKVSLCKNPKAEYLAHFENKFSVPGTCFTEQARVLAAIQEVRSSLVELRSYTALVSRIKTIYSTFATGTIKGLNGVLPPSCIQDKDADRKLWQDEFRFNIAAALKCLITHGKFSISEFELLIQRIQCGWKGNDYKTDLVIICEDTKSKIITQAELGLLLGFICSSDFLYIPVNSQNVGTETKRRADDADSSDFSVYNRNYEASKMISALSCDSCDLDQLSRDISEVLQAL